VSKRSPTTKDIALLHQLYKAGQLVLTTEFQRNSVWPRDAKAYLMDTILNDKPIPLLFFQRTADSQTGRLTYYVIDGQQRLRAIFDYLEDRFRTSQSDRSKPYSGKVFSALPSSLQNQIRNYDLVVEELSGYSQADIKDMFIRMNKYVVKLAPQELRHAQYVGKFRDFVEELGGMDFWRANRVFTPLQIRRMRAVEYSAEVTILLIEGPQDKKAAIDLYYTRYEKSFPDGPTVKNLLQRYLDWCLKALSDLATTRYRRPVDLYALIGALHRMSEEGRKLARISPATAGPALKEFDTQTRVETPSGDAARYLVAASSQTDNLIPRQTRIDVLGKVITSS